MQIYLCYTQVSNLEKLVGSSEIQDILFVLFYFICTTILPAPNMIQISSFPAITL